MGDRSVRKRWFGECAGGFERVVLASLFVSVAVAGCGGSGSGGGSSDGDPDGGGSNEAAQIEDEDDDDLDSHADSDAGSPSIRSGWYDGKYFENPGVLGDDATLMLHDGRILGFVEPDALVHGLYTVNEDGGGWEAQVSMGGRHLGSYMWSGDVGEDGSIGAISIRRSTQFGDILPPGAYVSRAEHADIAVDVEDLAGIYEGTRILDRQEGRLAAIVDELGRFTEGDEFGGHSEGSISRIDDDLNLFEVEIEPMSGEARYDQAADGLGFMYPSGGRDRFHYIVSHSAGSRVAVYFQIVSRVED